MNQPTNTTLSPKDKEIYKLFFRGGLQKYLPRDESRIYTNLLMLDSIKYCVKDFKSDEPTSKERDCITNFITKNYQLLNGNLEI
jgi:hypothetical protein